MQIILKKFRAISLILMIGLFFGQARMVAMANEWTTDSSACANYSTSGIIYNNMITLNRDQVNMMRDSMLVTLSSGVMPFGKVKTMSVRVIPSGAVYPCEQVTYDSGVNPTTVPPPPYPGIGAPIPGFTQCGAAIPDNAHANAVIIQTAIQNLYAAYVNPNDAFGNGATKLTGNICAISAQAENAYSRSISIYNTLISADKSLSIDGSATVIDHIKYFYNNNRVLGENAINAQRFFSGDQYYAFLIQDYKARVDALALYAKVTKDNCEAIKDSSAKFYNALTTARALANEAVAEAAKVPPPATNICNLNLVVTKLQGAFSEVKNAYTFADNTIKMAETAYAYGSPVAGIIKTDKPITDSITRRGPLTDPANSWSKFFSAAQKAALVTPLGVTDIPGLTTALGGYPALNNAVKGWSAGKPLYDIYQAIYAIVNIIPQAEGIGNPAIPTPAIATNVPTIAPPGATATPTPGVPGPGPVFLDGVFSCNSVPEGASINQVMISISPENNIPPDTEFNVNFASQPSGGTNKVAFLNGKGKMSYTKHPCAINQGVRGWTGGTGAGLTSAPLIFNTDACGSSTGIQYTQSFDLIENKDGPFTIVHLPFGDHLQAGRWAMEVTPANIASFNYKLTLFFEYIEAGTNATKEVLLTYDSLTGLTDANALQNLKDTETPFVLKKARITINAVDISKIPPAVNFRFKLFYNNYFKPTGEKDSDFYLDRTLKMQFTKYCPLDNSINTVVSVASSYGYDFCQDTKQIFYASFKDKNGKYIDPEVCDGAGIRCTKQFHDIPELSSGAESVYFVTRKCTDSTCTYTEGTAAYLAQLTVSDADYTSRTYGTAGASAGTTARFDMYVNENTALGRNFEVKGAGLIAEQPGTYEIRGFMNACDAANGALNNGTTCVLGSHNNYGLKFYITVPEYDALNNCYSPGTNGYYTASWNGCFENYETKLIHFTVKPIDNDGDHRGHIDNYSNNEMTFYLDSKYSSIPTALDMNSIDCSFHVIDTDAERGGGACYKDKIIVPAKTRVKISGGSFYAYGAPKAIKEGTYYDIAYVRYDTYNKLILHINFSYEECKPEAVIPKTGLQLQTPKQLSVIASEKAQSSDIVFTGNSLRISAIGLGMEVPVPIVHVYYKDGDYSKGWDLKPLGGYIGEIEGGSYIPYAGNSALTGHFYSAGVFANLKHLKQDDEINVFANDGIEYVYRVTEKLIVEPEDVYQMFQPNGERSVTLVTCEDYNLETKEYEKRLIVRATLSYTRPIK